MEWIDVGRTALHLSASHGHVTCCQLLPLQASPTTAGGGYC